MHTPEAHGDAERLVVSEGVLVAVRFAVAPKKPPFAQPVVPEVLVERAGVAAAGRAVFRVEVRVPRPARVQITVHGAFAQNRRVDFTPSRRRLLDGVAIPVPHRSTELASTGWFMHRPRTRSTPPTRRE